MAVPRCRESAGTALGVRAACRMSLRPFGKAGTIGINLLAKDQPKFVK